MQTRDAATTAVRTKILEAVLDELAATGSGAITLQSVATRADTALRTIYNHFVGRDELLTAAFLHHAAQTMAAVSAFRVPNADPERQLHQIVAAYYDRYSRMGPRLSVLLSLRGIGELDEQVRAIRGRRRQLLERVVESARQAGNLAVPPPTAVALAFTITSHAGWEVLRHEVDGDSGAATRVANEALSSALFHRYARSHRPDQL